MELVTWFGNLMLLLVAMLLVPAGDSMLVLGKDDTSTCKKQDAGRLCPAVAATASGAGIWPGTGKFPRIVRADFVL